ncbi:coiled-coil domain-containing protein 148-like [Watersipora subatra]|uniref:coiled-coil domain-containing protein 148-like n=1 Tax=Watersipora subatra TaxID=2589382 RepID=UPI00355B51E9
MKKVEAPETEGREREAPEAEERTSAGRESLSRSLRKREIDRSIGAELLELFSFIDVSVWYRSGTGLVHVRYRSGAEKLALRLINGIQSNKYKALDYDQLKQKTQALKFKGNNSLMKIKQIEQASKNTKIQNMEKQHKAVWAKELNHLNSLRKKNTVEVDLHIRQASLKEDVDYLFDDIEEFSNRLGVEFTQFKKSTVDPIWELREDLKYWIVQMAAQRQSNPETAGDNLGKPDDIMETIISVQKQQDDVLERLRNEQVSFEQELSKGLLEEISNHTDARLPVTGIPNEALALDCPEESLKISILQEFLLIDQRYTERIDNLDEANAEVVCFENGGWSNEEHFQFQAILDQHPFDLKDRRTVYIDRLKKQFPLKTRAEIVEHEDWVLMFRNYQRQKKSLCNDWIRDRKELLIKAKSIFHEAQLAHELEKAQSERAKQQQELCSILYEKVRVWREERVEIMLLKQKMLADEMKIAQEERLAEEERIKQRRVKTKEKIKERQETLREQRRLQAEEEQARLEELQKRHAQQAIVDAERVRYREQLEQEKAVALNLKKEELVKQEIEKEERLEALREKVRVVAAADPYRLVKDTKSWHQRRLPESDGDVNMHQPLFDIHTFNASQISSDPRMKLEDRLRQAGLHTTKYARQIMAQTEPAKPPRKDTLHTLKLGD